MTGNRFVSEPIISNDRLPSTDDDRGPKLNCLDSRSPQNGSDFMTASQVNREFGIGIVAKATQVNDSFHARLFCRCHKILCCFSIFILKVFR